MQYETQDILKQPVSSTPPSLTPNLTHVTHLTKST